MVRGAALSLVFAGLFLASACSSGPSGTVTLASTPAEQNSDTIASPSSSTTARAATNALATTASRATATPASVSGAGAWYTSSANNAKYYYCESDRVDIAAKNRRSYPSEQALLVDWSGKRTKWPQSKC